MVMRPSVIESVSDLLEAAGYPDTGGSIPAELPDFPSVIEEIEGDLVKQLKAIETALGVTVIAMPDKIEDLRRPFPKGVITVHYLRSEFPSSAPVGLKRQTQSERMIFSVNFSLLNLRSHRSAYSLLWAARLLLLGYRPRHSVGNTYIHSQAFARIDPKNRVWEYRMDMAVPTQAIAQGIEPAALFLLKLNALNGQGDLFMSVGENDD